ncbi:MON2-like protein [Elysia marginata]|uniref:MON2-like protein n=1 Tax=Elysia marginata TaxID=1093978 RepID=A0AAV4G0V1_9GAST|nr:MON2-like protein [Elysia marginata]
MQAHCSRREMKSHRSRREMKSHSIRREMKSHSFRREMKSHSVRREMKSHRSRREMKSHRSRCEMKAMESHHNRHEKKAHCIRREIKAYCTESPGPSGRQNQKPRAADSGGDITGVSVKPSAINVVLVSEIESGVIYPRGSPDDRRYDAPCGVKHIQTYQVELVCQHSHAELRSWGAEAVTSLVKAALAYKFNPPVHENLKLQQSILFPLQEVSNIPYNDIRGRQLESLSHILHNNGDHLLHGWPCVLGVLGALTKDHGEKLIQQAFQCLQLVVTDFLPIISPQYLQVVVQVAERFGLQQQELNVSLTAIGLLWNISDFFFQNRQRIKQELDVAKKSSTGNEQPSLNGNDQQKPFRAQSKINTPPPFDALWMCLFSALGELCVDLRPAVRKSAGQTLFSTISAHGALLQPETWHNVLWQVLFPLLENVQKHSSSASTTRDKESTGNILIHHSRDTAEKQWAETRVLSLAGVARTFNAKRKMLQGLGTVTTRTSDCTLVLSVSVV